MQGKVLSKVSYAILMTFETGGSAQPSSYTNWGDMAVKLQNEVFRTEYVFHCLLFRLLVIRVIPRPVIYVNTQIRTGSSRGFLSNSTYSDPSPQSHSISTSLKPPRRTTAELSQVITPRARGYSDRMGLQVL